MYQIIALEWDQKYKVVVGVRQSLDDDIVDEDDENLFLVDGENGLRDLVNKYEKEHEQVVGPGTTFPTTWENFLSEQKKDPNLLEILMSIDKPGEEGLKVIDKVHFIRLEMEGGELGELRQLKHHTKPGNPTSVTVMPEHLKQLYLREMHDALGHPGATRTINTLRHRYYWKGMNMDIRDYVNGCIWCKKRKAYTGRALVPVQKYEMPRTPFEVIHVDLTGKLPETASGNQYIMVVKDKLTKWVELFALRHKTALEVAITLVDEIFMRYGPVQVIITDRGTEFINFTMKEVCMLLRIRKINTIQS
jgi:hypothetical protein